MKSNTEKAVLLIAALSLLLGLSIGKIQQQYSQIQSLKSQAAHPFLKVQVPKEFPSTRKQAFFDCQLQANKFTRTNCWKSEQLKMREHPRLKLKSHDRTLIDLQDQNQSLIIMGTTKTHPRIQISIEE